MAGTAATASPRPNPQPLPAISSKEIRINFPKEFSGAQHETTSFLQDISLYLTLNHDVYDDDNKKIVFALSFMNKGSAQAWKESFIIEKTNRNGTISFGTWNACKKAIEDAFLISDIPGNARAKLRTLRQTGSANEYVGQFRILAQRSKITDDAALIEYFMEGLKPKLLEKIYALETIPTTIDEWYSHACRFDNQWLRVQEIIGRQRGGHTPVRRYAPTPRYSPDPNAMDIDRLSTEQMTDHVKKGLCFHCHKTGHRSRECPDKQNRNQNSNQTPNRFQNLKKTGRTTYAMVRSLAQELDEEERSNFLNLMEQEGF